MHAPPLCQLTIFYKTVHVCPLYIFSSQASIDNIVYEHPDITDSGMHALNYLICISWFMQEECSTLMQRDILFHRYIATYNLLSENIRYHNLIVAIEHDCMYYMTVCISIILTSASSWSPAYNRKCIGRMQFWIRGAIILEFMLSFNTIFLLN